MIETTRIAVLSDTHGNVGLVRKAVDVLRQSGITRIVHCGDICSPGVVGEFTGFAADWVFGNCDFEKTSLLRAMREAGHECHGRAGFIELDGLGIGFSHGDNQQSVIDLLASRDTHFVFHGHTHERRDERIDGTRLVNPGAFVRADPPGFAILDAKAGNIEWVDL